MSSNKSSLQLIQLEQRPVNMYTEFKYRRYPNSDYQTKEVEHPAKAFQKNNEKKMETDRISDPKLISSRNSDSKLMRNGYFM